jgi:cytochrome c oxidase subunit 2
MSNLLAQLSQLAWPLSEGGFWMPRQSSSYAADVDFNFYFVLGITVFFTLLILGVMVLFAIRYRQRSGHRGQRTSTHNTALELTWTIIPLILVLLIFYFNFNTFINIFTPPADSYDITVTARKWGWSFTYPNGHTDENLHVPQGRPVRLILTSSDVIHSLYVPAFRMKRDAVPGRFNTIWFTATEAGPKDVNGNPIGFDLFCTEYCGMGHSDMLARVYVWEPDRFVAKLEELSDWTKRGVSPQERGLQLWTSRGCSQCHSIDGTRLSGPTWKDLYGHTVELADGTTTVADENYVRESILYPERQIVRGFDNVMPSYRGQLKDNDILALVAYLKTISTHYQPSDLTTSGQAATTRPAGNAAPPTH